jgi:GNAT superfamily N-acetyltransferase
VDEVVIRPATEADVAAMEAVMIANEDAPPGEPPYAAGPQQPYLGHLVRRGRVAVAVAGSEVVGFGAAAHTGRSTHLADLFVLPSRHGQGVGKRLLDEVLGGAWPRTTFASSDPRALPLYVRAGMIPLWTNIYVSGDPALLPPPAAGYRVDAVPFEEVVRLEREWIGAEREPEVPYWRGLADVRPIVVRAFGRVVATGMSRRRIIGVGRWINHLVAAPGEDPGPALYAGVREGLQGTEIGGACVPGPSPLLRPLLEAGFRIRDRDTFLASDQSLLDPAREIVNTGLL